MDERTSPMSSATHSRPVRGWTAVVALLVALVGLVGAHAARPSGFVSTSPVEGVASADSPRYALAAIPATNRLSIDGAVKRRVPIAVGIAGHAGSRDIDSALSRGGPMVHATARPVSPVAPTYDATAPPSRN